MDIITGYLGEPHVTAEQDRDVNIGVVGDGSYVMPTGQRLAAEVQTNNEVRIRDGVLIHQGCAASIKKNTYDTVTITNGSQGMKRIDLIVARYQRNVETGVESLGLVALQGTPVESDPAVPVHTEGDIQAGDAVADMPLYEVEKDGLNITRVTKVFEEVESLSSLNGKMTEVGSQQSYSENGWSVSYRSIGANRVYFITSKTVSSIAAGGNQLEIAALPFKVAFEQHIYLAMNVSGTPVGYGYTRIVPTSGSGNTSAMYRHCAGYSNAVTMLAFGELVIQ